MEQKKIPFSGIDRATDDGVSQDGACMELINARIKHGSVEAIGKPVLVSELSLSVKTLYYHAIASKVIAFASNGDIYSMGNDYSNPTKLSDDISGADRVEFLGNLCCFFVGKDIRYVLYKNGGYYYLGTKPRLPSITITQTTKVGQALSSTELYPDITKFSDIDDSAKVPCASTGYYDSIVHDLNRDGYYTGAVLLRYALRLTNNSYICHSPIMVVNYMDDVSASLQFDGTQSTFSATLSQKSPFVYANKNWDDTTYRDKADIYKFALLGIKHSYSFSSINLSVWKGLIASIDVFVSPLCWYSKEKVEGKNYEIYEEKSIDKYGKSATDAHMFYKVAEYAIDGTMNNRLDDVSIDSLSVQETLTDDQFSNNLFSGATSYVYNSMLHIGNVFETLFKGYDTGFNYFKSQSETVSAEIFTTISTQQGDVVVKSTATLPYPNISPYIGYPDSRATQMIIVYAKSGSTYSKTFALKAHAHLNYAYYHDIRTLWDAGRITGYEHFISLSGWNTDSGTYAEQNATISRENVLKVSSLNNPLNWPAEQTYQPSTAKIAGMCANTQALSQGQFGQHPLYVFCGDGVYAMSVGTDGTTYSSQHPITRDVCINTKSIKGIDQAVVFASKRGLMMIAGSTTKLLSEVMEGYLPSCFSDTLLSKVMQVGNMSNMVSSVIFRDYIEGASVGYNYQENELIVSNPDYAYSYLYGMDSGVWSKLSVCVQAYLNKYPDCYALIGGDIYDMQNNHRSVSTMALVTKPIKFSSNAHKRILQTALRGVIRPSKSDLYLRGEQVQFRGDVLTLFSDIGMYILGSNDAEHFDLAGGREKMTDIRDLITKMNKSKSYKYFVLALIGGVRTDVSVNYMEFMVEESFGNRLR